MDVFDSPLGAALGPARRILLAGRVRETESPLELSSAIEKFRMAHPSIRKWQALPF